MFIAIKKKIYKVFFKNMNICYKGKIAQYKTAKKYF